MTEMLGPWNICTVSRASPREAMWAAVSRALTVGIPKPFEPHIMAPNASDTVQGALGFMFALMGFGLALI
jgi:hypothetical protein